MGIQWDFIIWDSENCGTQDLKYLDTPKRIIPFLMFIPECLKLSIYFTKVCFPKVV